MRICRNWRWGLSFHIGQWTFGFGLRSWKFRYYETEWKGKKGFMREFGPIFYEREPDGYVFPE